MLENDDNVQKCTLSYCMERNTQEQKDDFSASACLIQTVKDNIEQYSKRQNY